MYMVYVEIAGRTQDLVFFCGCSWMRRSHPFFIRAVVIAAQADIFFFLLTNEKSIPRWDKAMCHTLIPICNNDRNRENELPLVHLKYNTFVLTNSQSHKTQISTLAKANQPTKLITPPTQ
jgi:hypothetical protein